MRSLQKNILLLVFLFSSNSVFAQITPRFAGFGDNTAFPNQVVMGRSGSMGLLKFTIEDNLRDPYINPAKIYYKKQKNSLITAPFNRTVWFDQAQRTTVEGQLIESVKRSYNYRTYLVPFSGTLKTKKFYAGGYIVFLNYKNNVMEFEENPTNSIAFRTLKGKNNLKGFPFQLYTGLFLSEKTTLGVSYKRSRLDYESRFEEQFNIAPATTNITRTEYDQNFDLLKVGFGTSINDKSLYLLTGLYKKEIIRTASNISDLSEGILFQIELKYPISEFFTIATRTGLDHSKLQSERSPLTDKKIDVGNITSLEFELGTNYKYKTGELALEIAYIPLWGEIDYTSLGFGNRREDFNTSNLELRLGSNVDLSKKFSWQAGFKHSFSKDNLSSSFKQQFSENIQTTSLNPSSSSSSTTLTTGVEFQSGQVSLRYILQYANFPRVPIGLANFSNRTQIPTPTTSQVLTPITNQIIFRYIFGKF